MPPKIQPQQPRGGPGSGGPAPGLALPHVTTIGVRRSAFGATGRALTVQTNHFACKIPTGIITHYDVVISPSEKTLPAKLNMDLIAHLQNVVNPDIFTPRCVYDGRKNLFSAKPLPFKTQEFEVSLSDTRTPDPQPGARRGPKPYRIRLTEVATINPEVLARFLEGRQSHDNAVLTAITALNVVIRMEPTLKYPFNVRSFFTDNETKDIGSGLVLWRGYFQSVRPAMGKMLINIDISTGTMYKSGRLYDVCLEYLNAKSPNALYFRNLTDRDRVRLQKFISGMRVTTNHGDPSGKSVQTPRVIKKVTRDSAANTRFTTREGQQYTVAEYFMRAYNVRLKQPDAVCVEVGTGAILPLEVCDIPKGQIMRKQVPPEKTKDVLEFATKKPLDRLRSIVNGLNVLQYENSQYVRQFGMRIDGQAGPIKVQARVLPPPTLRYGTGSRQPTIQPKDGAWNMVDKKFYNPSRIWCWIVVVYERQQRFQQNAVDDMVQGMLKSFSDVGIQIKQSRPLVKWENAQGVIADQLRGAGQEIKAQTGTYPTLIVCVLPEGGADVYQAIKHFGDIQAGVATQCLKSSKCFRAKPQYYANVCLKINVKLGGVNTVPDPRSVPFLSDPANPTMVIGADVIHPAPGSDGRPSYTSVVGNVDNETSKYCAVSRVQASRQEMIEDLQEMVAHLLALNTRFRGAGGKPVAPLKRIIFYRDGVSEGQFRTVLDTEVPRIRRACEQAKMNPLPRLTVVVVGKRHHVRFFPTAGGDADRSGNCPAGTVVDRDVVHPTEFDFYLQSHAGLLGTSRPAHYSILHDENNFTPDGLQQLSFALCHVYARSTRSVSIPAPVYYADIVCSRAKNHYPPSIGRKFSEEDPTGQDSSGQAALNLEQYKREFKPLHNTTVTTMYFS